MLTEIICDKFFQKKIVFTQGLNVILGDDNATNSIGKSTFLLIIDFVFGGETYAKSTDIAKHIGEHTVSFCFTFQKKSYYFKRNFLEASLVQVCDNQYNIQRTIALEEFRSFLQDSYNIDIQELSWRQLVSLYMRIYGKSNLNEKVPLYNHQSKQSKDIELLLKIFDKFEECSTQHKVKETASDKFSAFKNAQKYNFIYPIKNKSDFNKIEKDLITLQLQSDNLRSIIETSTVDLTTEQLYAIADLKAQLSRLQLLKAKRQTRVQRLKNEVIDTSRDLNLDISTLLTFFPQIDIRKIGEIQKFHSQLDKILSTDVKKEIDKENQYITYYEEEESKILDRIKSVINNSEPHQLSIDRLIQLQNEINGLVTGRDVYNIRKSLEDNKKRATELYERMMQDALTEVQQELNNEITRRNDIIFNKATKSPMITLHPTNYTYTCNDDNGTGTNYKNLILFDLSILTLTCLPTLIHDTIIFKNIAVDVLEKIVEQYNEFEDKQIFIAFDNLSNFCLTTQEILRKRAVLTLNPNGEELFGYSWNKKDNEDI